MAAIFDRYPETCPTHLREAPGITSAARRFDTVIMGARTHQPALDAGLTSAYPHLRQIVVTHRTDLPAERGLSFTTDPVAVVRELKQQDGQDIWLCGGGHLAAQLIEEIDELQLKVNPVILGTGVPLFGGQARLGPPDTASRTEKPGVRALALSSTASIGGGVLLTTYRRLATDRLTAAR